MSIELLDLGAEGLDGLKEITSFYDQYSHVSALGVANLTMMESEGVVALLQQVLQLAEGRLSATLFSRLGSESSINQLALDRSFGSSRPGERLVYTRGQEGPYFMKYEEE